MGEPKMQKEISILTKEAFEDPAISDFRKQSRSFAIIARGVKVDDTEEVCGALMFDHSAGKLDSTQVGVQLACIDIMHKRYDQILQRDEILLQAKLREQTAVRLEERRARIAQESATKNDQDRQFQ